MKTLTSRARRSLLGLLMRLSVTLAAVSVVGALGALGSVGPLGSVARAQQSAATDRTEEAKGLFSAGRAAFDAGRYADALDYFERSYALSHRVELLYNIGLVRDRMRKDEAALEAYDAYLAALPQAPNHDEVARRADAIRAALAARPTGPAPVAAPGANVPTPEETARAASDANASAGTIDGPTEGQAPQRSVFTRWWFWTAVGVVVVGGVVAGVAIGSSGDPEVQKPLAPKGGVVVTTLRGAP